MRYQDLAFLSWGEGLGVNFLRDDHYHVGVALTHDLGRLVQNDVTHLHGLGNVDRAGVVKIFGSYVVSKDFPLVLRADMRQVIGGADGMIANVEAYLPLPGSSKRLVMFAGPSYTYADHLCLQRVFGVSASQSMSLWILPNMSHADLEDFVIVGAPAEAKKFQFESYPVHLLKGRRVQRAAPLSACQTFLAVSALALIGAPEADAAHLCAAGWWADFMLGSHHVNPYKHFDEFNPGVGTECAINPEWSLSVGWFRNSLDRPSFYGGAIYTPGFTHWKWVHLGVMGGLISGYNYGKWGIGGDHRSGAVLAPTVIVEYKRVAVNFILIPPIPEDRLPFTIGFQAKFRLK